MGIKKLLNSVIKACIRRKTPQVAGDTSTPLRRCLSTFDLTLIGIGGTLGTGIYVLTGEVAKDKAGPAVVLSFLVAAVASVFSGLCYAEFGARFPKAGSAYVYSYVAIGEFCAFAIGWNLVMEYIISGSTLAKGVSKFVDSLVHGFFEKTTISLIGEIHVYGLSNYFDLFSVILTAIGTLIVALGVKNSSRLNNFLVTLNIITLLIVTITGYVYADTNNWSNFAPYGFKGVIRGASTCFFAFIGFDIITISCEEAENAGKSVPLSILGTIVICCLAYLGFSSALTLMVPYYLLDKNAAVSTAFGQRKLYAMEYVVGIGATISMLACTIVLLITTPRLLYSMSKDGLLPSILLKVHEKTKTPVIGTIISGIPIALMAAILDLNQLVEMLSIGMLMAYSIVDISVLVLRYRPPNQMQTIEPDNQIDVLSCTSPDLCRVSYSNNPSMRERLWQLQKSSFVVKVIIVTTILEIFGTCIIIDKFSNKLLVERDPICITFATIFVSSILGNGIFLNCMKSNTEGLSFRVPCCPWIPFAALTCNGFLMLELGHLTWIRFGVWMGIGLVVYFCYSMHHSKECDNYVRIQSVERQSDDQDSDTGEKVPLLTRRHKEN